MALTKLDYTAETFEEGRTFGDTGPYELLQGAAHFALDPELPANQVITDLEMAPRGGDGRVHFSTDFSLLRPLDPGRGNRRLLLDVPNRGRTTIFRMDTDPLPPAQSGRPNTSDGWILRQGYTIAWCGWQHDVPRDGDLLGINPPEALKNGKPVTGPVSCMFQPNAPTQVLLLSDGGHRPNPASDLEDPAATLTVRDRARGPGRTVPRGDWSFARLDGQQVVPDPNHMYYREGFQPGLHYEVVYTAVGAPITGIGLAAARDIASFLRHGSSSEYNPCAGQLDLCIGIGMSQSGTFLRQMLYLGLCEDEAGRLVLDGILAHIAGGRRGAANWRFGQPSYIGPPAVGNLFPYADDPQQDPTTGKTDGVQVRAAARGKLPKVFYTNSSAEYWVLQSALIHTELSSGSDAKVPDNVRIYHFAGNQHVGFPLPLRDKTDLRGNDKALYPFNSLDYFPLLRAAVVNLEAWVSRGQTPPPSRYPRVNDGTAVDRETLAEPFERIPGVRLPDPLPAIGSFDYGPEAALGRATKLPPDIRGPYPALVPAVDDDCNDLGGIRVPDVAVPLATYTGWNARHPDIGGEGQPMILAGATLTFPRTASERKAKSDPRPSIEERYRSKEAFLEEIRNAGEDLVRQGYMLAEDLELVVENSARRYDEFTK